MSSPTPSESNQQKLELAALSSNPIELPCSATGCLMPRSYGNSVTGKLKRKLEFEDGRHVAKTALRMLDCDEEIQKGEDRCPIWPAGFVGSISHSENFAWAVAGTENEFRGIGIDTEPVADEMTAHHLRAEIGIDSEWWLGESAGLTTLESFTTIFSAKESFYKCLYQLEPVFFGFHEVQVKSVDGETLVLELTDECPDELQRFDAIQIEYIVTNDNVFTACWMRSSE